MKNVKETQQSKLHRVPKDFKEVLQSHTDVLEKWNSLTPLARNEWICWITSAKLTETRERRIQRTKEELLEGKKRPCCWAGCPHRNPNTRKRFREKK